MCFACVRLTRACVMHKLFFLNYFKIINYSCKYKIQISSFISTIIFIGELPPKLENISINFILMKI